MARYTMELRTICEIYAQGVATGNIYDTIEVAIDNIFDFPFPIYDPSHKRDLCRKIIEHYYTYEIAHETVALWKMRLRSKMNEIMPYYNELYRANTYQYNPLFDIDLTRSYTSDSDATTDANSKSDAESKNKYSNTPQGGLQGVESGEYLTDARIVSDVGSTNTSTNSVGHETATERVSGVNGGKTYAERIIQYKNAILNVDLEVINALSPLFFGLWQ